MGRINAHRQCSDIFCKGRRREYVRTGARPTGGKLSIIDSLSPVGSGPPRHDHAAEDETLFIVTGRCRFWLAGEEFVRGPGEAVFIPRGLDHTFHFVADIPCRHILILTPGGFEGSFAEIAVGRFAVPADMPSIEMAASHYNLRFTGPPLDLK